MSVSDDSRAPSSYSRSTSADSMGASSYSRPSSNGSLEVIPWALRYSSNDSTLDDDTMVRVQDFVQRYKMIALRGAFAAMALTAFESDDDESM